VGDDFDGGGIDSVDTSADISDTSNDVDNEVPDDIPADIPEDVPDSGGDDLASDASSDIQEDIPEDVPEDTSVDAPEDAHLDIPGNVPEDISDVPEEQPAEQPKEIPDDLTEEAEAPDEMPEEPVNIPVEDPTEQPEINTEGPADLSMGEPTEPTAEGIKLSAEEKEPLTEQIEKEATLRDDIKDNPEFFKENGDLKWPEPDGFEGEPQKVTLQTGDMIDRYGPEDGFFTSSQGTPYEERSLPYDKASQDYNVYEVVKPIDDVLQGQNAPAFNQRGGGMQQKLPESVEDLVENGFLKRK